MARWDLNPGFAVSAVDAKATVPRRQGLPQHETEAE
jgi:hypothetical protein